MNSLKEIPSIEKTNPIESIFSVNTPDLTASKNNSIDEKNLSKSVFFACTICAGPLIPTSTCVFCKKTYLRKCTKCTKICQLKDHEMCKILICFGSTVIKNKEIDIWKYKLLDMSLLFLFWPYFLFNSVNWSCNIFRSWGFC